MTENDKSRKWCKENDWYFCEPGNPWPGKGRAIHYYAEEVGEQMDGYPGGDIVRYRCKTCHHSWTEELPQ